MSGPERSAGTSVEPRWAPERRAWDAAGPDPTPRHRAGRVLDDAVAMVGRGVRLDSRDVESLLMGIALPVMLMVVFVYIFGGAIDAGTDYLNYVTPGIILLCAGFGAASTAVAVQQDIAGGIMDRFRSMPLAGPTILVGHVVASLVRNLVTTAIVLGLALLMGFRPVASPAAWAGAVAVIGLYVLAITWFSTFVGVVVRSPDAANGFTFFMLFLPYVSSAFVPVETMPPWLRGVAEHQPVTPVIETIRGLLVGTPLGSAPALAVAWCVAITAAFVLASGVAFARRRTHG